MVGVRGLRRLLDTGKLAPEEALAIVPQICDALQYAHDAGVVYRDIKTQVESIVATPLASGESAAQVPASSSPPKVSMCYVSTLEHLRSFRGRFFYIYKGKR